MKRIKIIYTIIGLILVCLQSCTEEISLQVNHEPQLIIYGTLSNETQPVSITIQQSVPINSNSTSQPVANATVMLYTKTNGGAAQLVTNTFNYNQGTYTSAQPINTQIGNDYWIEVTLPNGTIFKSTPERLQPVVQINSIDITDEEAVVVKFSDPANSTDFYVFTSEALHFSEVVTGHSSPTNDVVFDGNTNAEVEVDPFYNIDEEAQEGPITANLIRVTIKRINFESFQFYLNQTAQMESNESEGSGDPSMLFATPPVNLTGNITDIQTNKRILGNFTVQSVHQRSENITN